jgi:hypothetical protein
MTFRFRKVRYGHSGLYYRLYVNGKRIKMWMLNPNSRGITCFYGHSKLELIVGNLVEAKNKMVEEYCKRNGVEKL